MRDDSFDAIEYLSHLRAHWKAVAAACVVACVVAFAGSLLLPKKYTATTRLVIEAPAGSDPRGATAVSPIYIDSLRTYEHFASSDSLFSRALDRFELRREAGRRPFESWKRSVLSVDIPRGTKILEISATLGNARKAHALALFLAQETMSLNRTVNREGDEELVAGLQTQRNDAATRLRGAEAERNRFLTSDPAERLEAEIDHAEDLESRIEEQLLPAQVNLAEDSDRAKALTGGEAAATEVDSVRADIRFSRVRAEVLRKELDRVTAELAAKRQRLAQQRAREDELSLRVQTARAAFDALEGRLRDARAAVGSRGEQIKIVDEGIVPERPSSPNPPLNVAVAFLLASAGSLLFVTLEYAYRHAVRSPTRAVTGGFR